MWCGTVGGAGLEVGGMVWKNDWLLSVSGSCHRGIVRGAGDHIHEHEHQVTCGTGEEEP